MMNRIFKKILGLYGDFVFVDGYYERRLPIRVKHKHIEEYDKTIQGIIMLSQILGYDYTLCHIPRRRNGEELIQMAFRRNKDHFALDITLNRYTKMIKSVCINHGDGTNYEYSSNNDLNHLEIMKKFINTKLR